MYYMYMHVYACILQWKKYTCKYRKVHAHTYIYIHIHAYTNIYMQIHTHTCIYIHYTCKYMHLPKSFIYLAFFIWKLYTCKYIQVHTHTYTYIHIHTYTYIYMQIHANTCTQALGQCMRLAFVWCSMSHLIRNIRNRQSEFKF